MATLNAYWLNGTAYCAACVESVTSPCMSEGEKARATMGDGIGQCGCCGQDFVAEPEAADAE